MSFGAAVIHVLNYKQRPVEVIKASLEWLREMATKDPKNMKELLDKHNFPWRKLLECMEELAVDDEQVVEAACRCLAEFLTLFPEDYAFFALEKKLLSQLQLHVCEHRLFLFLSIITKKRKIIDKYVDQVCTWMHAVHHNPEILLMYAGIVMSGNAAQMTQNAPFLINKIALLLNRRTSSANTKMLMAQAIERATVSLNWNGIRLIYSDETIDDLRVDFVHLLRRYTICHSLVRALEDPFVIQECGARAVFKALEALEKSFPQMAVDISEAGFFEYAGTYFTTRFAGAEALYLSARLLASEFEVVIATAECSKVFVHDLCRTIRYFVMHKNLVIAMRRVTLCVHALVMMDARVLGAFHNEIVPMTVVKLHFEEQFTTFDNVLDGHLAQDARFYLENFVASRQEDAIKFISA